VRGIADMEQAFGGVFVRARASLGVTAFGMQVIDLPPASGDFYPEHLHAHDEQEEVYVLLEGEADLVLADAVVELTRETFVRVGPHARRRLRSGPSGARVLVVGGTPGVPYRPAPISELGGPEILPDPTASSATLPDGPPPQLTMRGRY
jgi:mannose-6-phosphate isomerase-like protein (cupin superfamily)